MHNVTPLYYMGYLKPPASLLLYNNITTFDVHVEYLKNFFFDKFLPSNTKFLFEFFKHVERMLIICVSRDPKT